MAQPVTLPKVLEPPQPSAHRCCSQRTITVPGDVDYKSRQRHYWGSRDWISSFSRRSRVEGWFGNLKDRSREALGRGAFRVMGLCKSSLMLGIYAAATNLRLLDAWATKIGLREPPALAARAEQPALASGANGVATRGHPTSDDPPDG